jgi:hypothetical protein
VLVGERDLRVERGPFVATHRQRQGQREERAAGEAHLPEHALVVGASHEAVERGESAGG